MSDPEYLPDDTPGDESLPDGTIAAAHLGVRVFTVQGSGQQELIDRIALILGEHLDEGDELHVSFNAMQNGQRHHEGLHFMKPAEPWTELFFEYSALLVLRGR